ncbi:STAS domain-containing protein [Kiritimatiella glycovorans]|uniref:Anti-sigma F factor antagonist n=1 Tax=Kiritimatiella glycovorans TaxID=1307763 RepID=A0A0G3EG34_9BACT|nr:STAS domain-containing protein [Kiritimatiella glycovorans]AKJ65406.1 anti-sigma F factor antagonist [Kiritimatiella glycovorans]
MNSETAKKNDEILACVEGDQACVEVRGRGTFKVSGSLKRFVDKEVREEGVRQVLIDFSHCVSMDSTFMGVLAGLSQRLRANRGHLILFNLSRKNRELLHTLGIDRVLELVEPEQVPSQSCSIDSGRPIYLNGNNEGREEQARIMLRAHRTLAELNEQNRDRFRNVIKFLSEDLDRMNHSG